MSQSVSQSDGSGVDGPRFVGYLYVLLVCFAGTAGFLLGTFVENLQAPRFLFVIPFPPTPFGFAAYGALTIAVALGIPLLLVVYVSENVVEE
ncbi:DUF7520 family protein [Halopelagius fulvigenes]|uniref:Cox cluster protein n=1 Tax=Halopelagius fulvigenes TaxID=1198324 RepID=A0ABD5U2V0_9EURY